MYAGHPTGTVTFLFTDIVDSSRLWDDHPVQMRSALESHDAVLNEVIAAHGGYVFTTAGDSFSAAFQTADAAAEAALAIQHGIDAVRWDETVPIRVRIGLHTGEAHERGGDYFGPVVNRAARIEAAGHGGQILLSGVTAQVLRGSTVRHWKITELGVHRLKGLTQPESIGQLGFDSHGPLRVEPDRNRPSLPANRTAFVGREREVGAAERSVREDRLVVVTGVGGVGKTRLAVEVGHRVSDAFAGRATFVDLSAVSVGEAVPAAVASALGVEERPGKPLTDSIVQILDRSDVLLVFDNCEHVIDAVSDLVDVVLDETESVHILCTSREALGLAGETVVHLAPHPVDGPEADGVRLFLDQARAVAPDADLTDLNAVVELCSALDGIALALELAAARTRVMSVAEILARLDERFRVLGRARRNVERHQTLRSTIEWSFDLLEPEEFDVLCRCSVFVGGFDLDAAGAVNPDVDELDLVETIDGLVRKSLLTARFGRSTRYSMLETIRQFAEERLARDGGLAAAADAHATHFARLAREHQDLWATPRQEATYRWLEQELPNVRAAFQWALDSGQLVHAADLALGSSLIGTYMLNNEPVLWVDQLLDTEGIESEPGYLGLLVAGTRIPFADHRTDWDVAADRAEAATQLAAELGIDELPPWPVGRTLVAIALHFAGRSERAFEQFRLIRKTRDPMFLPNLIQADVESGLLSNEESIERATDALAAADLADHPRARTLAATAASYAYADSDRQVAIAYAEDAVAIAEASRNWLSRLGALRSLAALRLVQDEVGGLVVLRELVEAAVAIDSLDVSATLVDVAGHLTTVGHDAAAATTLGASGGWSPLPDDDASDTAALLRRRLGDAEFDRLRDEGERMSLAEKATFVHAAIDAREAELAIG